MSARETATTRLAGALNCAVCGHPDVAHHIPPGKTHRTWCSTADPTPCRCSRYTPTPTERGTTP